MSLFHIVSAAAVTFVITRAGIFSWLRRGRKGWEAFVSCPLCVGFWVGLGLGVARVLLIGSASFDTSWRLLVFEALDLVAGGALVGAVALLFTSSIDWLDALERAANRSEKL